jgi:hypothetical protein
MKLPILARLTLATGLLLSTAAWADDPPVTCPSSACTCKTVKVYSCEAKSDGKLYNCRDVQEMQCTITSGPGSGKSVKVNR